MNELDETETERVCVKCGYANDMAARRCERCAAHLQIVCQKCGAINERVADDCKNCGTRLHRPVWQRIKSNLRRRVKWQEAVLIALGIVILIVIVIETTGSKTNPPAPSSPDDTSVQWK